MIANLLLTLLLAAPAAGLPRIATSIRAHPRLTVGDRFEVSLLVTGEKPCLITGPLADSLGVFAVAGERRKNSVRGGTVEASYRVTLAGFKAGAHALPVFRFLVQTGSKSDTLLSDTASVVIASVLPEKMQDIHGLAPAEDFPNRLLWLIPAAVLLLAVLAYLARRLYRRLRRHQELALAPLPPWDEALQALDAMPWREWLESGQVKRYYYSLSEVLKRYIERRFEFEAAEQTTTEVLASMRAYKTPMRDEVARFFERSDLVKYSKVVPSVDEAESAIERVREVVLKTRPAEPAGATGAPVAAGPAPAAGRA